MGQEKSVYRFNRFSFSDINLSSQTPIYHPKHQDNVKTICVFLSEKRQNATHHRINHEEEICVKLSNLQDLNPKMINKVIFLESFKDVRAKITRTNSN